VTLFLSDTLTKIHSFCCLSRQIFGRRTYRKKPKKRKRLVLQLATLEISIRSAPNYKQVRIILFLTLNRNLFESTLENEMMPSLMK